MGEICKLAYQIIARLPDPTQKLGLHTSVSPLATIERGAARVRIVGLMGVALISPVLAAVQKIFFSLKIQTFRVRALYLFYEIK